MQRSLSGGPSVRCCLGGGEGMDVVHLGLAIGFFALSWAFIEACDRLG